MSKKENVDIAVIQTDVKWIKEYVKEKLTSLETKIDNVQLCTQGHDDRIQKLEDNQTSVKEAKEYNLKWFTIIMAVVTFTVNIVFWIIERFYGV